MKIADYEQMMAHLMRQGYNRGGYVKKKILPKKNPDEVREMFSRGGSEQGFNQYQKSPKRLFIEKNLDKIKKDYIAGDSIPMLTKKYLKKSGTDGTLEQVLRASVTKSEMKKRKASPTYGKKGKYEFPTEKLIKIKNDYLKLIDDGLKKGDLSGVKPFTNYLEQNYPDDVNTIGGAFNKRGIKKPGKEDLFKARNILAKKLIVNPNLTLQDVLKKLTFNQQITSLSQVAGLDVDALPESKLKKEFLRGPAIKLEADVEKLLKSKTITDKLKAGKFPTITDVSKLLKTDPTASESRLADLALKIEQSNFSNKIKNVATNYLETRKEIRDKGGKRARTIYEKRLKDMLGLDSSLPNIRRNILRKITNIIPNLKGLLNVDEVGGLTSSMRRGSGPYAIFGQVLGADFNQSTKAFDIDKIKSIAQRKLNDLPIDSPERAKIIKEYNAEVDRFETEANKNNPAKKVKGQKISLKPPSETIKNKKVYKQYKDLFDDHFKEYGYSLEVDANTDSIPDIEKKLDNKSFQNTVKNRFSKLIGKGGKFGALVGLGTLTGTGFALADQPGAQETTSILPTVVGGGAGAAAIGTKTGRSLLGKAFRTLGTPLAGTTLAGTQIASNIGKGENIADAVIDPIVGLELSFPGLFRENISKITSNPRVQQLLTLGRFGRALTPVGLGITAAGAGVDLAKFTKDRINELRSMSPENRQKLQEQSDAFAFNEFAAAGGGIAKLAGKESGPPPEKGPDSEGLASLLKNVKKR